MEEIKYIGEKQVKEITDSGEKTASGISIISVEYVDGTKEQFSSLMLDKIISDEACDLSKLRDKRLYPIVEEVLKVLREWGIRISELQYMSVLLNQSIEYNQREAILELWSKWIEKPLSVDDVDMITIDKVLKSIKGITMQDVLNGSTKE